MIADLAEQREILEPNREASGQRVDASTRRREQVGPSGGGAGVGTVALFR